VIVWSVLCLGFLSTKKGKATTHSTRVVMEVVVIAEAYTTEIDPSSKDFMHSVEEDVKVIRIYVKNQEMDA
jgi:hypothetical protein